MSAKESQPAHDTTGPAEQIVEPEPVATVAVVETKLVEPRQWLGSRQQPYTVQLMSNVSADPLKDIARRLALTDAAVIPTFGSRQWFILVQGEFASMQEALDHLGQLPAEVKSSKPFPRGIETIVLNDTLREQSLPVQPDTTAIPPAPAATEPTVTRSRQATPAVTKTVRPETVEQIAGRLYQTAINEIRAGLQVKAAETLRGVLAIKPDHHAAREALAGVLVNTGRSADAIALMREGLAVDPTASSFAKLLARLLIDRGEQEAAIQTLENHRPTLTDDPDYHAMLAALYQRSRRNAEAAALYRQLVQAYPNRSVWWIGYGIASEANNNREQAVQAFRRARQLPGMSQQMRQFVDQRLASMGSN
jgi:Flp pilus assembly protein TadD